MAASTQGQEQAKPEDNKISPAELKKRAKAEKQARRAAQKEQQPDTGETSSAAVALVNGNASKVRSKSGGDERSRGAGDGQQKSTQQNQGKQEGQDAQSHHRRRPSQQQQPQPQIPSRGRPLVTAAPKKMAKQDNKNVELFNHLYVQPRRHTIEGGPKDVHPAVLALGLQMSSYQICGSTARCVAMLVAFKDAIQDYSTPAGTSLARHLTSHYLSPQIDFLKSCRPISESMGNTIRWLKKLIVEIDPNTQEQEAKDDLCEKIDTFIRERITVTDQAIAASASSQIKNGSVVLTYAKSSIVEKTIVEAHEAGTKFRVVLVDSRPLFEGKSLATNLMKAGIEVEYLPFSGISHGVKQATLVLLGAHSMLSNGRLQARIGTASIAMQAAKFDIPVIVCCESIKFSGKVALDSIVLNEIAPPAELVPPSQQKQQTTIREDGDAEAQVIHRSLQDWKSIPNLQILNLMYDVTPAEYIRMVICEYGSLPPSSVPVVHRLANEGM